MAKSSKSMKKAKKKKTKNINPVSKKTSDSHASLSFHELVDNYHQNPTVDTMVPLLDRMRKGSFYLFLADDFSSYSDGGDMEKEYIYRLQHGISPEPESVIILPAFPEDHCRSLMVFTAPVPADPKLAEMLSHHRAVKVPFATIARLMRCTDAIDAIIIDVDSLTSPFFLGSEEFHQAFITGHFQPVIPDDFGLLSPDQMTVSVESGASSIHEEVLNTFRQKAASHTAIRKIWLLKEKTMLDTTRWSLLIDSAQDRDHGYPDLSDIILDGLPADCIGTLYPGDFHPWDSLYPLIESVTQTSEPIYVRQRRSGTVSSSSN